MKKADRGSKRQKKKFDLRNLIFIGLTVYLVVLLFAQQNTLNRNRQTYRALQEKIAAAQSENERLQVEYEHIGSDEYLEEKARQAGLVRPDEIVFITGSN